MYALSISPSAVPVVPDSVGR